MRLHQTFRKEVYRYGTLDLGPEQRAKLFTE
jgi:hypothetical protein